MAPETPRIPWAAAFSGRLFVPPQAARARIIQPIMPMAARRPTLAAITRLLPAARLFASTLPLGAGPPSASPSHKEILRSPSGLTEVGLLDGAAYRIDVPVHSN